MFVDRERELEALETRLGSGQAEMVLVRARHHAQTMAADKALPFWPEEVGAWWSKRAQIDVVAVHRARRSALVGEARWRRRPMNASDLEGLEARARQWLGAERGWQLWYAMVRALRPQRLHRRPGGARRRGFPAAAGFAVRAGLAARGKTQAALRADLFRHLGVAESAKYFSMTVVLRLDLAKNLSLSHATDFHHGLLGS